VTLVVVFAAKRTAGGNGALVRRTGSLLSGEAFERGAVLDLPAFDADHAMQDSKRRDRSDKEQTREHAHPVNETRDLPSQRDQLAGYVPQVGLHSFTAW
jgi:hypothetical protein